MGILPGHVKGLIGPRPAGGVVKTAITPIPVMRKKDVCCARRQGIKTGDRGALNLGKPSKRQKMPSYVSSGVDVPWVIRDIRGLRAASNIRVVGSKEGAVAIDLGGTYVVSCYYSPNIPLSSFEERLSELQDLLGGCVHERTLVMGDFNAKSPAWGSSRGDRRGYATLELAESCGLTPLISEGEFSFERNGKFSLIDIALSAQEEGIDYRASKRVNLKHLKKIETEEDIDAYISMVNELVEASSKKNHPAHRHKRPVWWWTHEIATARKWVIAARRRFQRSRSAGRTDLARVRLAAYRALRGDLKILITKSKRAAWGRMIEGVGDDTWGKPY
ncbi:uncharacterized protein LOC144477855, partial [Augochlora pura]